MKKLHIVFRAKPAKMGEVIAVSFEDTCGNLIQLYQVLSMLPNSSIPGLQPEGRR